MTRPPRAAGAPHAVMNLAVLGANGPTGRHVVQHALTAGHHVTAVTRKPDQYPISSPHLTVAAADVTDPTDVDRVLHGLGTGPRAVISTYGVPYSRHRITVYSRGAATITRAMTRQGIHRLVCVTSTTVAAEQAPGETMMWRRTVIPLLRHVLGRTLYDDMARMEDIVTTSDLDWLIVRPAGLFNADAPSNDYQVSTQRSPGRHTSRPDPAQVLLNEATQPRHSRCTIEVLTRAVPPRQTSTAKDSCSASAFAGDLPEHDPVREHFGGPTHDRVCGAAPSRLATRATAHLRASTCRMAPARAGLRLRR